jgi:hypothetical protein
LSTLAVAAMLGGCAGNDGAMPETVGSVPAPATAQPTSNTAFVPENGPAAAASPVVTKSQGADAPTPERVAARAAPVAMSPPAPAIQHFTSFFTPEVAVYDRPYGHIQKRIPEKSLPREAMRTDDGRQGVPIYDSKDAYAKIRLADGSAGWITIDSGRISARPCELSDHNVRASQGPIGAGATDVSCVEKKKNG